MLLETEADALHVHGLPVAETYVRAAAISIAHAITYIDRGLAAEGVTAVPGVLPRGLLEWI